MRNERFSKIKKVTLQKPYIYFFLFFLFLFILLNILINKVYVTREVLFDNLVYGIPFILFNIIIAGLVALNINLVIIKYREFKMLNKKGSGLTSLGIFIGFVGGACPGCFVGLFPAFVGLFGVSASLSILPFYGIELQILSAILLSISVYLLTNPVVCKVNLNPKNKGLKDKGFK